LSTVRYHSDADYDGAGAVIPPPPVCVTNGNKTTGGEIGIMVMIAILAVLVCGNRY
jgi:hypothetical protein